MAFEHKPGQFSLFRADQKGNEKAPQYRGEGIDLDGKPIRVSAWVRHGSKGDFFSCSISPKDSGPTQRREPPPERARPAPRQSSIDDGSDPF